MERVSPGYWRNLADSEGARNAAVLFSLMERSLWIADKSGRLVRLHFNTIQCLLAQHVALCWHLGLPVRLIVPKYRQGGITTWWFAFFVARCLLAVAKGQAFRVGIVSHEEDGGETVFQIIRRYIKHLPPELNPATSEKYKLTNENSYQVRWQTGASIQVYSVKKLDALGRGGTLNALHCTEAGSYGDKGVDPGPAMAAIKSSLADTPDALPDQVVVYESTAKGHDSFFWPMTEQALTGKSNYVVKFLPWYLEPTYRMGWVQYRALVCANPKNKDPGPRFSPTPDEVVLRQAIAQPVLPEEEDYRYQADLADEQLIWRRAKLVELDGGLKAFKREFPSTLEEAFEASESCMFPADVIAHYESLVCDPILRADVRLEQPTKATELLVHPTGQWAIWEERIPGEDYLISADVSAGVGGDASNAYVFHEQTCKIVARFHGQIPWEDYARLLEAAAYYWNMAYLVIESNVTATTAAGLSTATALHRNSYPKLHYHVEEDRINVGSPDRPGFVTTPQNRALVLAAIEEATRKRRLVCHDPRLPSEMRTFVLRTKKDGTPDRYMAAPGKHDDAIMSAAIGCYMLSPRGIRRVSPERPVQVDPILQAIERFKSYNAAEQGGGEFFHL